MPFSETEEWMLLQQIISHYANQLRGARDRIADLQRRLDAAHERLAVLEGVHYGVSWL
jgi:hypothetical protein